MQTDTWIIQGNSFHFGIHGFGQEKVEPTFHSDSLFSALLYQLAISEGDEAVKEFINQFEDYAPPFVITSTFPCAGDIKFFPMPLNISAYFSRGDLMEAKLLKKIKFISSSMFFKLIIGQPLSELLQNAISLQDGIILLEKHDLHLLPEGLRDGNLKFWQIEQRPRVRIAREQNMSSIFFTGRTVFSPDCGLWFGVRWLKKNNNLQSQLTTLLDSLSVAGIGAERNAGFGACELRPSGTLDLPPVEAEKPWVNLSRYLPRQDESGALSSQMAVYSLETVGGWLGSPVASGFRRRPLRMITEGSVFGPVDRYVPGQVVDVRPRFRQELQSFSHPVYRSGLAFKISLERDTGIS